MKHRPNYGSFVIPEDPRLVQTRQQVTTAALGILLGLAIGVLFSTFVLLT